MAMFGTNEPQLVPVLAELVSSQRDLLILLWMNTPGNLYDEAL